MGSPFNIHLWPTERRLTVAPAPTPASNGPSRPRPPPPEPVARPRAFSRGCGPGRAWAAPPSLAPTASGANMLAATRSVGGNGASFVSSRLAAPTIWPGNIKSVAIVAAAPLFWSKRQAHFCLGRRLREPLAPAPLAPGGPARAPKPLGPSRRPPAKLIAGSPRASKLSCLRPWEDFEKIWPQGGRVGKTASRPASERASEQIKDFSPSRN